jgi:SAM-dependent methyltransferase
MTVFDTISETYDDTRQADARIVARLLKLLALPSGSHIADIGAGTGSYSIALADAGFRVRAIEPSSGMRSRARQHADVQWLAGTAEHLPLPDASVDGVVSTLAVCHFASTQKAITEMTRISRTSAIVILTFDCGVGQRTWLYEYFPFLWDSFVHLPSPAELARMLTDATGCRTDIEVFSLPPDLADNFAAAAWRRPRSYLDEGYRANISSFHQAQPEVVAQGVRRLTQDLANGAWRERHGAVLELAELDAGYRFVFTRPRETRAAPSGKCDRRSLLSGSVP